MTKSDLEKISLELARISVGQQAADGSQPPGTNGPYRDSETPVRCTSHWLITYLWSYTKSHDPLFKTSALAGCRYLMSPPARPYGFTFHCRTSPGKDKCSGLIGQAWAMEALAAVHLPDADALAQEIFFMHRFHPQYKLWHRREITGSHLPIDATLNHQIWFAAAASLLHNPQINQRLMEFLDQLDTHLTLLPDGTIFHPVVSVYGAQTRFSWLKWAANGFKLAKMDRNQVQRKLEYKSVGYHIFVLYGLAVLHQAFPTHSFFKSEKFHTATRLIFQKDFTDRLQTNQFGAGYNPVGFEFPLLTQTFFPASPQRDQNEKLWLNFQFKTTYNARSRSFNKNTLDPVTLTARIYELTRWL